MRLCDKCESVSLPETNTQTHALEKKSEQHLNNIDIGHICLASQKCGRDEGVQGVLTLFCSGTAQVCHDDRVVELREQLDVEEEDGDRQEEEVEEKGEVESRRVRHG